MKRITSLIAVLLLSLPLSAFASTWVLDNDHSTAQFKVRHLMISNVKGTFEKISGTLNLDDKDITKSKVDVTIETASLNTNIKKRDDHLRSPDFFWAGKFPQAVYHAARFERAGAGWRAPGELTIRGVKKPVPVTFTLAPGAGPAVMKGNASLSRLAFGLGQGEWTSTEWVGDAVDVRFELKLQPAG
jgi:polyisoprenoid-binding protein YceI